MIDASSWCWSKLFLTMYWINRGVSLWLLARTASRTRARSCNARVCRRCGQQSVQRVVRGLDAAMLERVVVVVGSPYSESYMDWMLQCWSVSSLWSAVRTASRTWTRCRIAGACRGRSWCL